MFKEGDDIITAEGLLHEGADIGRRLGVVLSTDSHVVIMVHQYNNNPVKVFRSEIEHLRIKGQTEDPFDDLFPGMHCNPEGD